MVGVEEEMRAFLWGVRLGRADGLVSSLAKTALRESPGRLPILPAAATELGVAGTGKWAKSANRAIRK